MHKTEGHYHRIDHEGGVQNLQSILSFIKDMNGQDFTFSASYPPWRLLLTSDVHNMEIEKFPSCIMNAKWDISTGTTKDKHSFLF